MSTTSQMGRGPVAEALSLWQNARAMRRWLLLLLILLAFGLRVYHLDHFGFWQDEGLTPLRSGYSLSQILSNQIILQEAVTQDTHPPFYYIVIHLTRGLFGRSDFAFRYPSVLSAILLVPILYQFGRRLAQSRRTAVQVGLLAALLAAVNPLQVWYAQEARMYSLAVLLSALATYALWRALSAERPQRWIVVYALFAGLAFTTHYTAGILVAAQVPFWLWLLWQRGQRRLILIGLGLGLLLLIPFIPFTVPRLFTGAETNYSYVSPLIMLQDVVHGFALGVTVDFSQWYVKLLDVGMAGLLAAGVVGPWRAGTTRAFRWRARSLLLVYLLAIVVGLALGSLIKPMYQGVRHIMIGSPALLLLLSLGVVTLWQRARPLGYAALAVVLVGPLLALNGLYFDDSYAKDDVRALIDTIERRAGADDLVVYNNAVLLGLHWHYQQRSDLDVTALPVYPYTAGGNTVDKLETLRDQYRRIWFVVDPPADGRDPGGLVAEWLETELLHLESHTAFARTIRVGAVAYDTRPWRLATVPPNGQPLQMRWGDLPELAGWHIAADGVVQAPTLWLDLLWRGNLALPTDHQLRFRLLDPNQRIWLDESRVLWADRKRQRLNGDPLLRLSYGLTLPAGLPPGPYTVELLAWDAETGSALGDWTALGSVTVSAGAAPQPTLSGSGLDFKNGLHLLGLQQPDSVIRPGHSLPLQLFWQADRSMSETVFRLELVGPDDQIWFSYLSHPGPDWLESALWPADQPVGELIGLTFPVEAPSGTYRLRWRLLGPADNPIPVKPTWRPWYTQSATLGTVTVEEWPLVTTLPAADTIVQAQIGPAIKLYGYDIDASAARPGATLPVTLYWRAREVPEQNLFVFLHLVSEADQEIVAQIDRIPVNLWRPTRGWRAGEVLTDSYQLPLPADLPSGTYTLYTGLYNPDTLIRPPLSLNGEVLPDGRLALVRLTIDSDQ